MFRWSAYWRLIHPRVFTMSSVASATMSSAAKRIVTRSGGLGRAMAVSGTVVTVNDV